jgi:hypothetical protein
MRPDPTVILTREDGTPIPRPEREDYPRFIEFLEAWWAYQDEVAAVANQAFAESFAEAMKEPHD